MIFKRLKIKFIFIYTFFIFIIVTISFITIFLSTYKNIMNTVKAELILQEEWEENIEPDAEGLVGYDELNGDYKIITNGMIILENDNFEIEKIYGNQEFSADEMIVVQEAINDDSKYVFRVDDRVYAYKKYGTVFNVINITNDVKSLMVMFKTLFLIECFIILMSIVIGFIFSKQALKPLKDSFNRQKMFISDVSHELRTPLSVIISCLELIKNEDDESEKWIAYCIAEAIRLKTLTSTMLTLSENKDTVIDKEIGYIDASKELEFILSAYEVRLFEQKYSLQIEVQKRLYVKMMRDEFKQIIHILLDNAIKYNDENKIINVTLKKEGRNIILNIENTSVEVSRSDINKFFDRFYRNDISRNKGVEGFGLGLAIIRNILVKYNLKYHVKYADGKMIFTFKFPINGIIN